MNHDRSFSSPDLLPQSSDHSNDSSLEGVSANVKLLLKIIQDHNNPSQKDDNGRKTQRVQGMLTILDELKHRIEKSQCVSKKKEFRRCNTDLRPMRMPKEKKPPEPMDEKQKLMKQLNDSLIARKSLEKMFTSLGREKAIISAELAKKVQQVSSMEEQLNDLKEQNAMLMEKLQICATKHKDALANSADSQTSAILQERNKALSEQLLRTLDGYRSLKRKMREAQEESASYRAKLGEMAEEIVTGLDHIHALQRVSGKSSGGEVVEELSALEHMLRDLEIKASGNDTKPRKVDEIEECDV